jgi:PGF-CTERM protein
MKLGTVEMLIHLVEITMKGKGDEQQDVPRIHSQAIQVRFRIELGEEGSLLFPVDPASWEDTFQEGGEIGATPAEDTPGFTLVVASAAIAMAAFINQRRPEAEE